MDFENKPYKVYVKTDAAGRIIAINSDAFISDLAGWIEIDSGYEDKFHHAQGNYLPGYLTDDRGMCRYKLEDGKVVERTQEEMDADYTSPVEAPAPNGDMAGLVAEVAALRESNTQLQEALTMILEGVTEDA